jgi:hypothetical protein
MVDYILWGLGLLSTGLAGYLAGYLKKKGENRAIQEDLDKLLVQVSVVTKATKEIEAKISSDVWDRQKHWELKREVLFEATKRLAEVEEALLAFNAMVQVRKLNPNAPKHSESSADTSKRWNNASAAIDETRLFVAIVCGEEAREAFDEFALFSNNMAAALFEDDANIYLKSRADLTLKLSAAREAVRKELGVEDLSTQRSN